ncbi:ATP-binding protein [Variovorax sp. PBL-H6]|uniref:acetyl/propionyl/methylcrotonyl-CoA carboxylase subunit alpha n=1 Tax=Variovorax sp. PBL-H6 TaxID=434009 RepID=UPI001E34FCFF
MRTASRMGYRTVAVHSEVDAGSPHVEAAQQTVCIGAAPPAQSYLNIDAILRAAKATGADAIHPGYGFLAENEDFAAACREAGLVFIGPSPEAIRAMGDKAGAKRLMIEAGVPCIPGYQGDDQGEQRLSEEAARIGYPVMIKATAGGGGRGMRLVKSAGEFKDLLRSAQSEAKNAFGDATVILERAIIEPRHIEIQVFADRFGNAVHLGERDCSVQRRHQKVIEEAPSPAVNAELRARMGATAVAAVKAIGYEGAGTLEFLLDREGHYYFMEMNTRLQVEHPVTEAITGLDLVEWQLRVAAGEPLPLAQDAITFSGHAIEVRLCAEDVPAGFMPQSGTLLMWRATPLLRVEHALRSGADIPPDYDSMIAKLVSHGADREEARRKLVVGLENTVALGVRTNQSFLAACLDHAVFSRGDATTAFIAQHRDELLAADAAAAELAESVAAVLLLETSPGARGRDPSRRLSHNVPLRVRYHIDGGGGDVTATLTETGPRRHQVSLKGRTHEVEIVELLEDRVRFVCDGVGQPAAYHREGNQLHFSLAAMAVKVVDTTRAATTRTQAGSGGDGKLRASMNGRVVAVLVAPGQQVDAGQPLMTLEAMKMEHLHASPVAGTVKSVHVAPGDQVATGRVLVEIDAELPAA